MTITRKIAITFAIVIALLIGLTGMYDHQSRKSAQVRSDIDVGERRISDLVVEIEILLLESEKTVRSYLIENDEKLLDEIIESNE